MFSDEVDIMWEFHQYMRKIISGWASGIMPVLSILLIIFMVKISSVEAILLTGREIIEKADAQFNNNDGELELIDMKLVDKKGLTRDRELIILRKRDTEGNDKSLIKFLSPSEISGTGLLTLKNGNGNYAQWVYLPFLRKIRRVSFNRMDLFLGTDFTYEDLLGENLDDHLYRWTGTEVLSNHKCYIVEATLAPPKKESSSRYGKRKIWVREDIFFPVQIEFYDKEDNVIKVGKAYNLEEITDNNWRANKIEMFSHSDGHKTILLVKNRVIGRGIDDRFFSMNYLEIPFLPIDTF